MAEQTKAESKAVSGLVCLDDIPEKEVGFLWLPYFPKGKLTLIEGDPDTGKSGLVTALAAAVTTGAKLADGTTLPKGNVLMLCAEDGLADTVKVRLRKAGADTTKVFSYSPGGGGSDAEGIRERMELNGDRLAGILEGLVNGCKPALITVDPVTAYMGLCSRNDGGPVRQFLAPLASVTEKADCVTAMVRHLNKNASQKALYRGGGSIDFSGVCRSVVTTGINPEDPESFVMAHTKHNLSKKGASMKYHYDDAKGFVIDGPVDVESADLVTEPTMTHAYASKLKAAEEFLRGALSNGNGSRKAAELQADARVKGISIETLRDAKRALRVKSREIRSADNARIEGWAWSLS